MRPIRTGLCAFGMSGKVFHAPFLSCMPQFELAAVVERHQKKAAQTYRDIISYDKIGDLLADPAVELVVVNTPNATHYEYTRTALEAGKHVVVEKPFTATAEEARQLIRLAGEQERFLAVFQNRRWDSDFLTVQEVIGKGVLGTLIETEIRYDRYRLALNSKKPHKEKPGTGVGNIYDLGPHLIDEAIVLFGKPDAVFAVVQTHRPGSLVDDYFDIKLLYDQFTCTLKSSLLVKEPLPGYVVHGTAGSFIKARADVQEANLQAGMNPCTPGWGKEQEEDRGLLHILADGLDRREKYPSVAGCYQRFYEEVYKALREDGPSPVLLRDSLLNIQLIEAAIESSREKKVVGL